MQEALAHQVAEDRDADRGPSVRVHSIWLWVEGREGMLSLERPEGWPQETVQHRSRDRADPQ